MAITDDLQQLFEVQSETLATEFKSWLDLSKPEARAVLAKAAIALANHGGGTIIMGMREAPEKPVGSHPRPAELSRYTADAVNAAINKYADPRIHCDVVYLTHPTTGHEHAFVIVPGGHGVPVMSIRDLPGTIMSQRCYVRKPGPKSEEPFTAEEWRALINACVKNDRESLLEAFRIILEGQSLRPVPTEQIDRMEQFRQQSFDRWTQRVERLPSDHPSRFIHGYYEQTYQFHDVAPAEGLTELKRRMQTASEIKHTGWGPFVFFPLQPIAPVPAGDSIEAWIGHPDDDATVGQHADFWRAHPEGLLYELRGYDEDFAEEAKPGSTLDLTLPIWRIGETLLYVARLAKLFGDEPEISILVQYRSLMNRKMKSLFDRRYLSYDRQCVVDSVTLRGQAKASVIEDNTVEVLLPLLRPLYEAFDFAPISAELVAGELGRFRNRRF
jgi:hypothetical protein